MYWTAYLFLSVSLAYLFRLLAQRHHDGTAMLPQTRDGGNQIKRDGAGPTGIGASTDATNWRPTYLFLYLTYSSFWVFTFCFPIVYLETRGVNRDHVYP
jgi:hypothetical protein